VISDEGEVAVLLAPGHLVDTDLEQVLQPVRIKLISGNPGDDPSDHHRSGQARPLRLSVSTPGQSR
jgi:hypothetical protein